MKHWVGNPWSLAAACGAMLTLGVGDVPALVGTTLGLVLAWRWFGRISRS